MPYKEIAKKYNLPSYEALDKEFDFSGMEETPFVLREIRKKILEKLNYIKEILEDTLQPEASLSAIIECKYFTDKQKEKLYSTYRQIMQIMRHGLMVVALEDEEKDAQFIKETYKEWQTLKKEIADLAKVLQTCWIQEEKEEKDKYLG